MKKLRIKYTLEAPLSHIGESASSGSYFQTILTADGKLPVVTGNSIRGQIRDAIALHWLGLTGAKLDKDTFNIFFSGGNLNGTMKNDVAKATSTRSHFPMISLLGGGLGDMILAGRLLCSMAYPICRESEGITGIPSFISWHNLIEEIEFTRTDDSKDDALAKYLEDTEEEKTAKASTQMRFSVQYMAAGTELIQTFIFLPGTTDLEMGAFFAGLREWWKVPRMGGMASKGFGFFKPEIEGEKDLNIDSLISGYEDFVKTEGTEFLNILSTKKVKKNGKTSDDTN